MSWMKNGDTAATYPPLMSIAGMPEADERTINEVAGFIWRASTQSAAHTTDYIVDMGTLYMLGGSRTELLLSFCVRAGLMSKVDQGGMISYKITADPEFIHIRLKAEVEWERQQRNDTRDLRLIVPIRLRDGDNCRWCGVLVHWRGNKTSGRFGEFDHLNPGQAATVDTMVVACRGCNGQRNGATEEQRANWEDTHTLRPAPSRPLYGKSTAKLLQDNGYPDAAANISSDEDPERPQVTQAAAQRHEEKKAAPQRQRPNSSPAAAQRHTSSLAATSLRADAHHESQRKSQGSFETRLNSRSVKFDLAGSGRDGTEQGGSTQEPSGPPAWALPAEDKAVAYPKDQPQPASGKKRRRGKRGGRKSR